MKINNILYLSLILLLFGICACDNDDEPDDPTTPTPTEDSVTVDIVTQNWQVDETTADSTTISPQNVQFSLTEGMEYTLLIPGLNTFGTTGTWIFNSNKTAIILDDGNIEVTAKIISIDENQMVLEFEYDNFKGQSVTYRITLDS